MTSTPSNNFMCVVPGCTEQVMHRHYDGRPHCSKHYNEAIFRDFAAAFQEWRPPDEPSGRFRTLLGRVFEEFWESSGDSYLSKARITGRAFDFSKTDGGCTFKIVRHPGAFRKGYVEKRLTQTWKADFEGRRVELVETREFREGDID